MRIRSILCSTGNKDRQITMRFDAAREKKDEENPKKPDTV
jgi:hypothetical protein